jgi:class 3 adenylate cyclase
MSRLVDIPETRYAITTDGAEVAYQVWGDGPADVVLLNFDTVVDLMWDEVRYAAFLQRIGSFARTICFDRRGWGSSDSLAPGVTCSLEGWLDDINSVMSAVGSEKAALVGASEAGKPTMLFAATYPDRVASLVLFNAYARFLRAGDYPFGLPEQSVDRYRETIRSGWGTMGQIGLVAPSMAADQRWCRWYLRSARLGGSPNDALEFMQTNFDSNVHRILPSIQAPTRVIYRPNLHVRAEHSQYLADSIPGATLRQLPGEDLTMAAGDSDALAAEIEEFVTGSRPPAISNRILATMLFTDIVGSTQKAGDVGDQAWLKLLEAHDSIVRSELQRYRGQEVDTAGDGFLATFDGPARAIRCAIELVDSIRRLGLDIRAGVHTGEVEVRGRGISGIAVHTGARVAALAGPGEVLVSSTVRDLVAGSGTSFQDRGEHELRGVPGTWRLFSVAA